MTHVYLRPDAFTYMTRFVHMCDHTSTSSILALASSTLEFFEGTRYFRDVFDLYARVIWHLCEYLSDTRLGSQFLDGTRCLRDVICSYDWVICVSASAMFASAVIASMVLAVYVTLSVRMTELFVWVPRRCLPRRWLPWRYPLFTWRYLCVLSSHLCEYLAQMRHVVDSLMWHESCHVPRRHVTHVNEWRHVYEHVNEWRHEHSHVTHVNESCHKCQWDISHTWMSDDMHMKSHALEACHMPRRYSASSSSSEVDVCVYTHTNTLHTHKYTTKRMTELFVWVSRRYYRVAKTYRMP